MMLLTQTMLLLAFCPFIPRVSHCFVALLYFCTTAKNLWQALQHGVVKLLMVRTTRRFTGVMHVISCAKRIVGDKAMLMSRSCHIINCLASC